MLENYKYLFGLGAIALLVLPALPGIGTTVNGARLWVHVGPLQFQPGEFAKIALIVFLAGYLREKREVLAQGRLKDFGPLLVIWGGAMLVLVETNDLGSALLYFGIFLVDALRRDRAARVRRRRARALRRAARSALPEVPHVRERVDDLAPPVDEQRLLPRRTQELRQDCRATSSSSRSTRSRTAASAAPGSGKGTFTTTGRPPTLIPYAEHRLHLLGARAGARADRRRPRCSSSTCSSSRAGSGSRSSRRTASRSCSPPA